MVQMTPTLAIVCSVFAALSALIFVGPANFLLFVLAMAAAVVLFMHKDKEGTLAGVVAVTAGALGGLGVMSAISFKGGADFSPSIDPAVGHAFLIIAMVAPAGWVLWHHRNSLPTWALYTGAAGVALTVVLSLAMSGQLADQSQSGSFLVFLTAILTTLPSVVISRMSA